MPTRLSPATVAFVSLETVAWSITKFLTTARCVSEAPSITENNPKLAVKP